MEGILKGDKRSAAKAISLIENEDKEKKELLNLLYPYTGRANIVGITGSPGAGKSTLVDGLIKQIRSQRQKVGVIAIDPSSPYTGGALLGDRIRMQSHATDSGVFIRSMGSRGTLGGISKATNEAIKVMDAMGMDIILIETVGVGQSELEIIHIADSIIVVLHPTAGDRIQAFKAGIMEIADIFVINKSDLPGTEKLYAEIEMLLDTTKRSKDWKPPIIKTVSTEQQGLAELWNHILIHLGYISKKGLKEKKREEHKEKELKIILQELFLFEIENYFKTDEYKHMKEQLVNKEQTPFELAEEIFQKMQFRK